MNVGMGICSYDGIFYCRTQIWSNTNIQSCAGFKSLQVSFVLTEKSFRFENAKKLKNKKNVSSFL